MTASFEAEKAFDNWVPPKVVRSDGPEYEAFMAGWEASNSPERRAHLIESLADELEPPSLDALMKFAAPARAWLRARARTAARGMK
jgi:hypothetical protein